MGKGKSFIQSSFVEPWKVLNLVCENLLIFDHRGNLFGRELKIPTLLNIIQVSFFSKLGIFDLGFE